MAKKKIIGIEGMTPEQLNFELQRGARFVMFQYAISVIVMSFRRASDVYFIRAGESTDFEEHWFYASHTRGRLVGNSVGPYLYHPGRGHELPRREGRYERNHGLPRKTRPSKPARACPGGMNRHHRACLQGNNLVKSH